MGDTSSQTNNNDKPSPSALSKTHSKLSSSFGNPANFESNFQKWANEDKIPGLDAKKTYQIYLWEQGNVGHWSIVIGCKSRRDVGFVTMELRVVEESCKIIPYSQFIERRAGEQNIQNKKWILCEGKASIMSLIGRDSNKWNGEVNTTMRRLMKLTAELIQHHGKYSEIVNSCQDFVRIFCDKCAMKEDCRPGKAQIGGVQDTAYFAGVGVGVVGGMVCGGIVAGPFGVFPGAIYGALAGLGATPISIVIAKSIHTGDDNNKEHVKLETDV